MKKSFLLVLGLAVMLTACDSGSEEAATTETGTETTKPGETPDIVAETPEIDVDPATAPAITFEEENHDFGTIQQGEKVEHVFKFTNTGKSDLIITNAKASCGCTVPFFPKEPIAPGESSELRVAYNSAGKSGVQKKSVTVTANTYPKDKVIYIQAAVETPDNAEAAQ